MALVSFDYADADYALGVQAVMDAEMAEYDWQDQQDAELAEREWAYASHLYETQQGGR